MNKKGLTQRKSENSTNASRQKGEADCIEIEKAANIHKAWPWNSIKPIEAEPLLEKEVRNWPAESFIHLNTGFYNKQDVPKALDFHHPQPTSDRILF